MKNIILFGGSFDPPHSAHKKIIIEARRKIPNVSKIILMPCSESPDKKKFFFSAQERLFLLSEFFKNFDKLEVSEYEINKEGKSYTIDTIEYIKEKYPDQNLCLIIGTDQAQNFSQWKDSQKIAQYAQLWTFWRVSSYPDQNYHWNFLNAKEEVLNISSSRIKSDLQQGVISNLIPNSLREIISNLLKNK